MIKQIHVNSKETYLQIKSEVERDRHLCLRIFDIYGPMTVRQACNRLTSDSLNQEQSLLRFRPRVCELKKSGHLVVCKSKVIDEYTNKSVMVLEFRADYENPEPEVVINNNQLEFLLKG